MIDLFEKYMSQKILYCIVVCCIINCNRKSTLDSSDNPEINLFPYKIYNLFEDGTLDTATSEISISDFQPSSECSGCHPSQFQEWKSSMHHLSISSPLFLSTLQQDYHEFGNVGDRFCIQCHSPAMLVTGMFLSDTIDLDESSKAVINDGIGCDICHSTTHLTAGLFVDSENLVGAEYYLNPGEGIKYGPLQNPDPNEYHQSQSNSIFQNSKFCLPCHNLVINNVEAEVTFSEWASSPLTDMANNLPCQSCHMPIIDGHRNHSFTGVDIDLTLPLDNPLNVQRIIAIEALLDTAISLYFFNDTDTITSQISPGSNFSIPFTIQSNIAHSLPSGTSFNREAWIEMIVTGNEGQELCSFGKINTNDEPLEYNTENIIFTSWIKDENGDTLFSVIETASIEDNTLHIFEKKEYEFNCLIPEDPGESITISAKMRLRPFKPEVLYDHPELLSNLPVFDFGDISITLEVSTQ